MTSSPRPTSGWRRPRCARVLAVVLTCAALPATLRGGAPPNDGTLDPAFGNSGRVTTDVSGDHDIARALAVAPQGRIVVAGYAFAPGSFDLDVVLAVYDRDGRLDPTFGSGGRVLTDLGAAESAAAVAMQPNGRIVVAGSISLAGATDLLLLGYDLSGRLDPSFGDDGVVVADLSGPDEAVVDMALAPDGSILVACTAGFGRNTVETDFCAARFSRDGALDASFGEAGMARVDLGGADNATALAVHANGDVVVAGTTRAQAGGEDVGLVRLTRNGVVDTGFGVAGRVIGDVGVVDVVNDLALMPDGSIVLVGPLSAGAAGYDFLVLRYLRTGVLDGSFGDGGRVITDIGYGDFPFAVQVRADGTVIVAGYTRPPQPMVEDFALARYDRHGRLDPRFGAGGIVVTDLGGSDGASAVAWRPGGGIVVAGTTGYERQLIDFALAAYQ